VYREKDGIGHCEKAKAGWYHKEDGFQCCSKKNDGIHYVEKVDGVHYVEKVDGVHYYAGKNFVLLV